MNIKKLPSGQWQTVVSLGFREDPRTGKRIRNQRQITRPTKDEVRMEAARVLAEYGRGGVTSPGKMSFGEYLDYWIGVVAGDFKPNGLRSHRENIRAWKQTPVASVRLDKLGEADFLRARDVWTQTGKSPSTVGNRLGTAKVALRRAVAWKWLSGNPAESVKRPSPRRVEYTTWTEEEANRFLSVAEELDELHGPVFALILLAALREGEAIALRWQDITLDGPEPHMRIEQSVASCVGGQVVFGPPKTMASAAPVGLGDRGVSLLKRHRAHQKLRFGGRLPELVFTTAFGEAITPRHLRHVFVRLCKRADVPKLRVYDLRHTAATLARRAGTGIEEVARLLRHSDVATTYNTYSHVLPDRRWAGAEALNRVLGGAG